MKEGWTYKKLGEVCEIFNGNSINADYKKKHFFGATVGLPFIATKDVSTNGSIDYGNGVRIPNYNEYKVAPANSVFICAEGGSAGKKFAFVEQNVCFGNKLFCLNPKNNLLAGKYIYYFVQSDTFKDQFYALISGLIGGVSAKKFQQIEIPISPVDEQHSIVSRLDSAFAHIDALKANAEKQLAEARKLFQAELAECMRPKEGWEKKDFAECIDKVPKQKQVKSKDYQSSGKYPIVSQEKELISGYWDDEVYLYKHSKPIIVFGDHTKEIKFIDFDFVVGADGTQILNPKEGIDAKFFYYVLVGTPLRTLGYARHFKLLKEKTFFIPPLDTQHQIVTRLDALSAHVRQLEEVQRKTLAECDALKQAILREVFE